jgi:hypothetical protein
MRRKVDNGEAAVTEPNVGFLIDPTAVAVRATMCEDVRHVLQELRVNASGGDQPGDPAHFFSSAQPDFG